MRRCERCRVIRCWNDGQAIEQIERVKGLIRRESADVNRNLVPSLKEAQLMLAERESLEIWEFGEYRPISAAYSSVGGTKQQGGTQQERITGYRGRKKGRICSLPGTRWQHVSMLHVCEEVRSRAASECSCIEMLSLATQCRVYSK